MLLGTPCGDNKSGSSISSLMIVGRNSDIHDKLRVGDDESRANVVSDNATTDVLSLFQMCFGLVSKYWILWSVACLMFQG